jgi:hypothetical protein
VVVIHPAVRQSKSAFHPATSICAKVLATVVDVRQVPGADARELAKAIQQAPFRLPAILLPGAKLLHQGLVIAQANFIHVHFSWLLSGDPVDSLQGSTTTDKGLARSMRPQAPVVATVDKNGA